MTAQHLSSTHTDAPPWLVVRTHRAREEYAAQNAARQGCQCYLPLIYDELTKRESPFFPSYLFLRTPTLSVAFLESTYGIASLLRFGASLATIRDSELEGIFDRSELVGGVRALRVTSLGFRPGDLVRVRCGAFAGEQGKFKKILSGNRVEILLQFLGRKNSVKVLSHWVEAA